MRSTLFYFKSGSPVADQDGILKIGDDGTIDTRGFRKACSPSLVSAIKPTIPGHVEVPRNDYS